jgi:hypothetical protein
MVLVDVIGEVNVHLDNYEFKYQMGRRYKEIGWFHTHGAYYVIDYDRFTPVVGSNDEKIMGGIADYLNNKKLKVFIDKIRYAHKCVQV